MKFQASLIFRPLGKDIVFDALSDADADKSTDRLPCLNSLRRRWIFRRLLISALSPVQYPAFDLLCLFGLCALIDTEADCPAEIVLCAPPASDEI